MRLEHQILAAVVLDLLAGDPRWFPHPVRAIGWLAGRLESLARRKIRQPKIAGIATVVLVVGIAAGCAWGMIALARAMHPVVADVVSIGIIYTTIAARDLARHSNAVRQALAAGDLPEARRRVAMMVGRDTDHLDEQGIVRGTVESVAESTVDGVTAPLFFAAVAGPVGAMVYRAISTLDSTFGHRNERYLEFGWASAKLDDVANYIPARLTAPLICVAAALTFQRPLASFRTLLRDGGNHDSPNAGLPEAAMAGALGVRLGGLNYYFGRPVSKPAIGEPARKLSRAHIANANAVMFATAAIFLAAVLSLRHLALLVAERLGMTL